MCQRPIRSFLGCLLVLLRGPQEKSASSLGTTKRCSFLREESWNLRMKTWGVWSPRSVQDGFLEADTAKSSLGLNPSVLLLLCWGRPLFPQAPSGVSHQRGQGCPTHLLWDWRHIYSSSPKLQLLHEVYTVPNQPFGVVAWAPDHC